MEQSHDQWHVGGMWEHQALLRLLSLLLPRVTAIDILSGTTVDYADPRTLERTGRLADREYIEMLDGSDATEQRTYRWRPPPMIAPDVIARFDRRDYGGFDQMDSMHVHRFRPSPNVRAYVMRYVEAGWTKELGEDLVLWIDETCVLWTTSHEQYVNVQLGEDDARRMAQVGIELVPDPDLYYGKPPAYEGGKPQDGV